jgi:hypothetical protein
MSRRLIVLALTLAFAAAAGAAEPAAGFAEAQQAFFKLQRKEADADKVIDAFADLVRREPQHPLYLAYLGSARAMQGRDALMPWSKLKYGEEGADEMEKALASLKPEHDAALNRGVPESEETRLVAATALTALPAFMNRGAAGRRAVEEAIRAPAFEATPQPMQLRLLLLAAKVARQSGKPEQETQWLQKIAALAPASSEAAQAKARLAEIGR